MGGWALRPNFGCGPIVRYCFDYPVDCRFPQMPGRSFPGRRVARGVSACGDTRLVPQPGAEVVQRARSALTKASNSAPVLPTASRPHHWVISKPLQPCSATVGTSGSCASRMVVLVAMQRSLSKMQRLTASVAEVAWLRQAGPAFWVGAGQI